MKDNKRHMDNGEGRFAISTPMVNDPTLVVCPSCRERARVLPKETASDEGESMQLVCRHCGYNKKTLAKGRTFHWHDEDPTDSYFGASLWMKTRCCGHSLWAFNRRHLELLENYVEAKLRERREYEESGWANRSLVSRLPAWMKSAKNREEVLKGLIRLREMGTFTA